ncbi:head maturation protease, ClpP-related [Staphylococcus xylosus]
MTKQKMMKANSHYEFKSQSDESKITLTLSGIVAKPSIFNDETINAKDIREAITDSEKDVIIKLNSPGGDVFEGLEICNYLKGIDNHVTVEVTSLAASAASIIAMGADKISMYKGALMMIHQASTIAIGNKEDMQKSINALENIDESMVEVYSLKTGIDKTEIDSMLVSETWFKSQEAVDKGFADEVINKTDSEENKDVKKESVKAQNDLMEKITSLESEIKSLKNNQQITNRQRKRFL